MIGVIIQARINSTRLPGKVLKNIGDKTLLGHIFFRLSFLKTPVKTILATSINPENNIIEEYCSKYNIECFRGSENNVLERYYYCAKKYKFDHIVRLTGDNPFIDIEALDNLIDLHLMNASNYSTSFNSLPVGVGAEVFSFNALEIAYNESSKPYHFEHVNEYILENIEDFKISKLNIEKYANKKDILLTIDTEEDYNKAVYIVNNSEKSFITTDTAINLSEKYSLKG